MPYMFITVVEQQNLLSGYTVVQKHNIHQLFSYYIFMYLSDINEIYKRRNVIFYGFK